MRSVSWEIANTDETTDPADYALFTSGPFGSTVETDALTAGTAARLRCTINGGIDPITEIDSDEMVAEAKFYVPTAGGTEVLCADELNDADRISSLTHGAVAPLNAAIRALGGTLTSVTASGFIAVGANPATSGLFRGSNSASLLTSRDNAGTGNLQVVGMSGDNIIVGATTAVLSISESVATSGFWRVLVNGTETARIESGFAAVGTTPATSGTFRAPNNTTALAARNAANSQNINLVSSDSSNRLILGEDADCANIQSRVATSGTHGFYVNSVLKGTIDDGGASNGRLSLSGDGTVLSAGHGVLDCGAGGTWFVKSGGVTNIRASDTQLGFFGAAAVSQQADIGALTDSTGQTADNTIENVPDPADTPASADALRDDLVANTLPAIERNLCDLTDQVNRIRTVLRNLGFMA